MDDKALPIKLPLLITIPHSGEKVPDSCVWLKNLPEATLMRDVDRFVDRLYEDTLKDLGLLYTKTEWHRYAGDLNRLADDVDADSVVGHKNPSGKFARGFHWVITTLNEKLMTAPMSLQQHQELIELIYKPFHESVGNNYEKIKSQGFEKIYHLDLHSMPSVGTKEHRDPGEKRADVVVSDCKGLSSEKAFVDLVIKAYENAGLKVAYNWPYFGGRVSEQYGKPALNHHAVQVELNRALYMNEETKQWIPEKAQALQQKLKAAITEITTKIAAQTRPVKSL